MTDTRQRADSSSGVPLLDGASGEATQGMEAFKPRSHPLFSPFVILCFFTVVNIINYFDRGAASAMMKPIKKQFDLNNFEAGVVNSSFMVGFMVFSPIFAQLAHKFNAFYLMGIGLAIWSVSTVASGFAQSYVMLIIFRCTCGAGEASFACLVPPFIDDYAPPENRTKWLSMFYLAIPVGGALGFVVSGPVAAHASWRYPFVGEGIAMSLFVAYASIVPKYLNAPKNPSSAKVKVETALLPGLGRLCRNMTYVTTVMAYGAFTFVIGGLAVWMVYYLEEPPRNVSEDQASTIFGGVSATAGLLGTVFGGFLVDHFGGSRGQAGAVLCLKVCVILTVLAFPFGFVMFLVENVTFVYLLAFVAEFLLWATTSPVNGALLSMVSQADRPLGLGVSTFFMHLLGDFPSSMAIGGIKDWIGSWKTTMLLLMAWLGWAVLFWAISWLSARRPSEAVRYESMDPLVEEHEYQDGKLVA